VGLPQVGPHDQQRLLRCLSRCHGRHSLPIAIPIGSPGVPEHPLHDQKPGTSGLRKSSRQFEQPHYLESFIEAVFRVLPGVGAAPWWWAATAATAIGGRSA
jgi:hypothetical protein